MPGHPPPAHPERRAPSASPLPHSPTPPACFTLLIVCTGNLCRSPMAERLLRARLSGRGGVFRVGSAGTEAMPGTPMDPLSAAFLAAHGADPGGGSGATRLTARLVEEAGLVLGAAAEHREAVVRLAPVHALRRAFTLREFARLARAADGAGLMGSAAWAEALVRGAAARRGTWGVRADAGDDDVADPYGRSEQVVRECAERIVEAVNVIADVLLGVDAEQRHDAAGAGCPADGQAPQAG